MNDWGEGTGKADVGIGEGRMESFEEQEGRKRTGRGTTAGCWMEK